MNEVVSWLIIGTILLIVLKYLIFGFPNVAKKDKAIERKLNKKINKNLRELSR